MTWYSDTSTTKIGGSSLYAYTKVDWNVGATQCTYRHIGGVTSPYSGWDTRITGQPLYWEDSWHEYDEVHMRWYVGSGDCKVFDINDFFTRIEGKNRIVSLGCDMSAQTSSGYGTGRSYIDFTVPALPPNATTLVLDSSSDNRAALSWTNPGGIKDAVCIERRANGGAWGQIQIIWDGSATSWTDTSLAANNSYEYRFRYHNVGAYGSYSNVVTVSTAPSAPTSISVVSAGGTNVNVSLVNESSVATGIVWQWSPDKDDESSWSGSTAVSGSPVTSFVAGGVVGRAYIRVANTANGVQSGWIVSEQVITIAPPNPPVAKTPAGDVVSTDAESIMFSWDLNIIDKTDPTAYEFRYKVGEGSWVTTNKVLSLTANSHTLQMSTFSAGNVVTWQARMWAAATTGGSDTHGASEWSSPSSFTLHTPPQIEITSPNHVVDGVNTVSDMPILVTARITDVEGFSVDYAEMVLRDSAGIVYPQDGVPVMAGVQGGIVEFEIASSDFLPDNHSEYTVVVSATSGTTLSNTARAPFTTSFTEPVDGYLSITNVLDTGYVSLKATFDNSEALTWNQTFPQIWRNNQYSGWSLSVSGDNRLHITATQTVSENYGNNFFNYTASFVIGHKYAFLVAGDQRFSVNLKSYNLFSPTIFTAAQNKYTNMAMKFTDLPEGEYTFSPILVDLTSMFGEGKEPTSLADERIAWITEYAGQHPEYDEGSAITVGAEKISVSRVNPDGSLTTLIENGMSGAGAVDKYAPLNVPYQYAVTTVSEEDSIKTVYVTNIIRSSRAFFYFDDDMASARWNQSYNVSYGRPEQEELRFSGRTLPVLVDDRAQSIQGSASFTILDRSETAAFKRLMAHSGSVVYKSTDGDVMHAKVSVGFSRTIDTVSFYMQQLSINYTQVDGVVL